MAIKNASKNYEAPCNKIEVAANCCKKSSTINKFAEQYIQVQNDNAIHFHVESQKCEIAILVIIQQLIYFPFIATNSNLI